MVIVPMELPGAITPKLDTLPTIVPVPPRTPWLDTLPDTRPLLLNAPTLATAPTIVPPALLLNAPALNTLATIVLPAPLASAPCALTVTLAADRPALIDAAPSWRLKAPAPRPTGALKAKAPPPVRVRLLSMPTIGALKAAAPLVCSTVLPARKTGMESTKPLGSASAPFSDSTGAIDAAAQEPPGTAEYPTKPPMSS